MKAEYRVAAATALFLVGLGAGSILSLGHQSVSEPVTVIKLDQRFRPARAMSAELIVPVEGVSRSNLTDSWGAPRDGGRSHKGIDIMASKGTPVRATSAGKIMKLFESARGGTTIYQADLQGRFVFYYAHLDRYANGLKVGQRVAQGETIGYVGQTGNAPVPHLHFEIQAQNSSKQWWRGTALNPYPVLKAGRLDVAHASMQVRMK